MNSSPTAANSICSATAPATATVIPLTAREAALLLSWSLRVASCQGTGPPCSRFTHASTSHGSSSASPTRTSTAPPAIGYGLTVAYGSTLSLSRSTTRPATGISSRHQKRRLRLRPPRTTPSGSITTERRAASVTSTAAAGTETATSAVSAAEGTRSDGKTLTFQISM